MIRFLTPQLPPASAIERYFAEAREQRWFSNDGPCLRRFAGRAERLLGRGLAVVPTANCTLALMLGLRTLAGWRDGRRGEVLLPSFTFPATVGAIAWSGFTPVFADVDPGCWHLSVDALGASLEARGDRVAAVLACSTFGSAPPPTLSESWSRLCAGAGVPLLVDSAAGFGSLDDRGELLGAQGDAEVFSFHATKPFAIGEGGALVTAKPEIAEAARRVANFGLDAERTVTEPGLNAKMDEWHAATGLASLDSMDMVLAARRRRAQRLCDALAPSGFEFQRGSRQGTWQFVPALAPSERERTAIVARGRASAIEIRTYFDPPLHQMPAFAGLVRVGSLEVTDALSRRVLSLPMANDLSDAALDRIVACVLGADETATLAPGTRTTG